MVTNKEILRIEKSSGSIENTVKSLHTELHFVHLKTLMPGVFSACVKINRFLCQDSNEVYITLLASANSVPVK